MVIQKETKTSIPAFISLLFIMLLALLHSSQLSAQARDASAPVSNINKSSSFDWDRVVVGGGFGLAFGTITNINLSPSIGYKIKDSWLAGIGTRYVYFSDKRVTPTFTTNIYGGGPFTQFYFLENFLAHSEYEFLNVEQSNSSSERIFIQSWLVGGGYRSQVGSNSFVSFILLWDLVQDIRSPYTNPIIRVNFGLGL